MTQPTALSFRAHTGDPGVDGTDNAVPSTNGYADIVGVAVGVFDAADDEDATTARKALNTEQTFPTPSGPWAGGAAIDHWSVWDQTNTVFLGKAEFTPSKTIDVGDLLKIGVGTKFTLVEAP